MEKRKRTTEIDIKMDRRRKQKVDGGVKKQRWFRKIHKDHAMTMKWARWYKNYEID